MPKIRTNTTGPVNLLGLEYIDLYVKIMVLLTIIYVGYHFFSFTASLIQCKKTCRYLVQEGYNNFDDSKAYFSSLNKRCDNINSKLSKISTQVDGLEASFGTLPSDICYVTLQVDESLAGIYASNVPDEEKSFSADEQKKRADKRKESSGKFVQNLKKTFSQTNNNISLLECFEDSDSAKLQQIRDDLSVKIKDVKSNLLLFDNSISSLQKTFSTEILQKYYVTLKYNDKYIKQLQSAVEGFEEVFDFKPSAQGSESSGSGKANDDEDDPEKNVSALEAHFANSEKRFTTLHKSLLKYTNTIKKQTEQVKQAKLIVNDQDAQTRQINANAGAATKSA